MATTELPVYSTREAVLDETLNRASAIDLLRTVLAPLASLRLTVALLGLSMFLVLAGTVAQIDHDVWHVLHTYFRTWVAWIEVKIFFPRAWDLPEWAVFPFPGGKLLGLMLAVNLLAAHATRFKVAASGGRLLAGTALIAVGALVTYAVIASGANTAIESELSYEFTNGLWHLLRASLGGGALALAYVLALIRRQALGSSARWLWWFGAVAATLLLGLAVYLFTHPEVRLNPSGLRILWQLAKATGASVVLGLGCWLVFAKRAGIVLLHSGVALLMLSELYYAERGVEAQMRIVDGETSSVAEDIRSFELAVIDSSDEKLDRTTIVPGSIVAEAAASKDVIEHPELPFAVRVQRYFPNASVRLLQPGEKPVATHGHGQLRTADPLLPNTGVNSEQAPDFPAAYVQLLSKKDRTPLGLYLLRPYQANEWVEVDGKSYQLTMRFKQVPKDWSLTLKDFRFEQYEGSETPKNFESIVQFRHPEQNVDLELSTSMNNPIRYAGDTIYQASYDPENPQLTILQVVTNNGWMIPYVACMIIAAGMLVHFVQGIVRFVRRREEEARRELPTSTDDASVARPSILAQWRRPQVWGPAIVVFVFAAWVASRAMPPREAATEMKIHEFGRLPVAYGGRTQPLDSLANNTLRTISGRETYEDVHYDRRQPAVRWLLDVVTRSPAFRDHKVVRIENLDVLQALGLKRRAGSYRYSISELLKNADELERQAELARGVPKDKLNLTQQKFLELDRKVRMIMVLMDAFGEPEISGSTQEEVLQSFRQAVTRIETLNKMAPRPVPPATPAATWQTMMEAETRALLAQAVEGKAANADDAAPAIRAILDAYREDRPQRFNSALAAYREIVAQRASQEKQHEAKLPDSGERSGRKPAERLELGRIGFEAYFNHLSPFVLCMALYIAAFVLAAAAWLGWFEGLNRSANWLLWLAFALHTFGLVCRIYISGRPPITNLYSSAVFIGWAGVFFALLFEVIYRLGVGNLLAAALGFPTMVIAYFLAFDGDGDTIGVMQAVLDTNFWLATHVVCITLGYATTLLAGMLGLATIVLGYFAGVLDDGGRRQLNRMTYGMLCFAIFFSFIGTILGGLWADDSWGRFWGWDPKENGALMIVIWNAIVLHSRWGKMVGERGLAALAVLGNIVVAWSWFGVNQMGVGLHAYGFTEGRTFWLAVYMLSQLLVVAAAYVQPLFERTAAPLEQHAAQAQQVVGPLP